MRPSFEDICMQVAESLSRRSTCLRTNAAGQLMQVGCVVASADYRKILAWGYNGNAAGLPNGCDSSEPGKCGCIHAETNAIVSCTAPRDEPKIVFCTHLPCAACAKLIIQLGGVREVYYRNDYRLKESLVLLSMPVVGITMGHLMKGDTKNQAQVRASEAIAAELTRGVVAAGEKKR